jgi:hypothetical protein
MGNARNAEVGMRKVECGVRKSKAKRIECGSGNREECGLRPLRAVGSIYEPEAIGDIGAYAPEGSGKAEI